MRTGLRIALACAAAVLAAGSAFAADGEVWTTAPAENGAFSVDTPCSTADVIKLRELPEPLVPGVTYAANTRVACKLDRMMLVAGVYEVANYPSDAPAIFDSFVEQAKNDKTAEGVATTTTINGHRAWLNRQEKGGVLGQTGFIEIDHSRVVLLVGGADGGSKIKIEAQRAIIDRFYGSVKVASR